MKERIVNMREQLEGVVEERGFERHLARVRIWELLSILMIPATVLFFVLGFAFNFENVIFNTAIVVCIAGAFIFCLLHIADRWLFVRRMQIPWFVSNFLFLSQ